VVLPLRRPLSDQIRWEFKTALGFNQARYGRLGPQHFRQYLPGGQVIETLHPPKVIDPRIYERHRAHQVS